MIPRLSLPLLLLLALPALAHNGRLAVAPPLEGIVVDGDLRDWPRHFPRYPLSQRAYGDTLSGEADVAATFRIGHDVSQNRLLIAVEVTDDSYVDHGPATLPPWMRSDGCELFLDVTHGQRPPVQLAVWGVARQALGGPWASDVRYEAQVSTDGGRRVYEWAIDAGSLAAGTELTTGTDLAFDVAVGDRDEDGSFTWVSWGPHTGKLDGQERLGDILLAGAGPAGFLQTLDQVGELIGRTREQAAESAQRNTIFFSFLGGALIAVTLLHLLLFWFQRESVVNLFHALVAGASGVAIAGAWLLPVRDWDAQMVQFVLENWLTLIYALSLLLLYHQFHGGVTRRGRWLLGWLVLGAGLRVAGPGALPVGPSQTWLHSLVQGAAYLSLVMAFFAIGALVAGAVLRRRDGAWSVGVAFLLFVAAAGLLVGRLVSGAPVQTWLLGGILLPLGTMSVRLARSVAAAHGDLARRYDEVQRLSEQLGEKNRSLEMANIRIRESNRQVEEANRMKSAFLAHMSHDLRTPMNAIIGYTRVLLRRLQGQIDERQYTNLENIRSSADHLLSLINDILDLSRIETGRAEVHIDEVDARQVVAECADTIESLVPEEVQLVRELHDVPPMRSDRDGLRRVTTNLLGNAVKFTEAGQITLRLRPADDGLELVVRDTGVGIPPEDLEHIFDEFRQVERRDRRREGSGLGLAIARRTVDLLGGTIAATSTVGEGSTFTVRLPSVPIETTGGPDGRAAPDGTTVTAD
jgi:signal transduction histidine kinase